MSNIFISYRRDDSKDVTGRIYDYLADYFGKEKIFRDVDSIPLGSDFRSVIKESIDLCDVMLVVISSNWLNIKDKTGGRRIDDADDFVRIEVESGLKKNIPIIPILLSNSKVPSKDQLPETLQNLSFKNGISIRPDPDFKNDINTLKKSLERFIRPIVNNKKFIKPQNPAIKFSSFILTSIILIFSLLNPKKSDFIDFLNNEKNINFPEKSYEKNNYILFSTYTKSENFPYNEDKLSIEGYKYIGLLGYFMSYDRK